MKIRVIDRLLNLLAGLILLALTAALAAEAFLGWRISARVGEVLGRHDTVSLVIVAAVALALFSLGAYCVGTLFRRDKSRRGFVVQKTEGGELSISMKAIESLVRKCLDRHDEIHLSGMRLDTSRDGLVIRLRIGLAGGVNIPLAVGAVQKQIKQYVTSCSGVDVKEVKVQVETSSKGKDSPFTVADLPEKVEPLPVVEDTSPVLTAAAIREEAAGESRRPLHQRLFRRAEEPANMPQPPVPVPEAEPVPAEEPVAEPVTGAEPEHPDVPELFPEEDADRVAEPEAVKEETHEIAE